MPTLSEEEPYLEVDISYATGDMATWSFVTRFQHCTESDKPIIAVGAQGRQTCVWIIQRGERAGQPAIKVMGFARAMRALSEKLGMRILVSSGQRYTCNERAISFFGIYGTYTPPPPPIQATAHPVSLLRLAHFEYAARVRGEQSRTRFGYCTVGNCGRVAAVVTEVADRPEAVCKQHMTFDAETLNRVIALVRRYGKIYASDVRPFGYSREAFAAVARDGHIRFGRINGMSYWEVTE